MSVGIRAAVYVTLGLGALVWWVPSMITDLTPGPLFPVGLPIVAVGLAVYLWTTQVFATVGQGTPVPLDPPRVLVARGPYRAVRNPMALGFTLILVGEAVAFGSWDLLIYAAALFVAIYLFVVLVEEPDLRRRFGPAYEAYCQAVPRWLPRLPRA